MNAEYIKLGKRGTLVIPAFLRHHFGLCDGDVVLAENHGDGILLKPTVTLPIEIYSDVRKAEFLLSNAITDEEYERAKKEVKSMGLDPKDIEHYRYHKKGNQKSNDFSEDKSHDQKKAHFIS